MKKTRVDAWRHLALLFAKEARARTPDISSQALAHAIIKGVEGAPNCRDPVLSRIRTWERSGAIPRRRATASRRETSRAGAMDANQILTAYEKAAARRQERTGRLHANLDKSCVRADGTIVAAEASRQVIVATWLLDNKNTAHVRLV